MAIASARPTSIRPAGASPQAIDGNPATAWGIYPEVGKSHAAVFKLREPLQTDGRCDSTWCSNNCTAAGT